MVRSSHSLEVNDERQIESWGNGEKAREEEKQRRTYERFYSIQYSIMPHIHIQHPFCNKTSSQYCAKCERDVNCLFFYHFEQKHFSRSKPSTLRRKCDAGDGGYWQCTDTSFQSMLKFSVNFFFILITFACNKMQFIPSLSRGSKAD